MQHSFTKDILKELENKKIIEPNSHYKSLNGGSSSTVGVITYDDIPSYVVKMNKPNVLQAESLFLNRYRDQHLFPRLIYTDAGYRYIVYAYMSGTINNRKSDKRSILTFLTSQIINSYHQIYDDNKWGWIDEPESSWGLFLHTRISEAYETMQSHLNNEDHQLIRNIVTNRLKRNNNDTPYLIHGDFGFHNFLFDDKQLVGVIDPTPVIGPPIYDLVYAFCSTPSDLELHVIGPAVSLLNNWQLQNERALYEEILLGLYCRIAASIRHHPEDLPRYIAAWNKWKVATTLE
ncbi:phosphotransferase family protein [Bacillus sp. 123MFChir2]|uniref:phosphotransferase family protein n=1 Tax=Bacillus sp. 123MFChir2 TaxID=1169144 RepID=UPI0003664C25|nr:phosphotransferase [Bacillus sp. 123MFChir2]